MLVVSFCLLLNSMSALYFFVTGFVVSRLAVNELGYYKVYKADL